MNIPSEQQDSPLILIVDDDKFMRLQTRQRMQKKGIEWKRLVMEKSLAAYTRIHPDIILLDAMMPVMDGFTCCAKLKAPLVENRTCFDNYWS